MLGNPAQPEDKHMTKERMMAAAIVVLMLAVVLLVYQCYVRQPDVVIARAVQLVDANGNKRALFSVSDDGMVSIGFADEQGKVKASFGLLPDGTPVAVMKDKDGKPVWGAP